MEVPASHTTVARRLQHGPQLRPESRDDLRSSRKSKIASMSSASRASIWAARSAAWRSWAAMSLGMAGPVRDRLAQRGHLRDVADAKRLSARKNRASGRPYASPRAVVQRRPGLAVLRASTNTVGPASARCQSSSAATVTIARIEKSMSPRVPGRNEFLPLVHSWPSPCGRRVAGLDPLVLVGHTLDVRSRTRSTHRVQPSVHGGPLALRHQRGR